MSPFDPNRLQTELGNVTCPKMRRAWRNRSNVTQWQWVAYARKLQGADANQPRIWKIAACLYVACGWYASRSGSEVFNGSAMPTRGWELIGLLSEDFYHNPPDRALTRGQWEQQRKEEAQARKAARKTAGKAARKVDCKNCQAIYTQCAKCIGPLNRQGRQIDYLT